ncbi:TonB-dependent receptor [Barnesiella sp. An22]|uniref:SusC/RagA family TonB-linked outer membrane protein n=1 Tax=Barnesiella sp. An22 TaxID=1965590 RepID=UPI000B571536|nr:TonB-dependent receptor [Barnesiella sp. An22]OUO99669.1 SusC/RagA family TonB-linked outer membrane protein [Barnesiella sp. An22]
MKRTILSATLLFIMAIMAQAQNITVHGKVLSKSGGEPLIGASVLCESTQTGASTDIDGNFTISVPEGATLKFSYIGFNPTEAKATPEMTIHLGENSEVLDDVVVVGYQIVRKADLTGAVSVMDMKEPLSENSGNIMSSMAGRLPGVNVVPDAAPGGTGTIRVRGMSTANSSNDPLYIIDGVPTDNINCINPSDIESMQVLKDAASASIYGSRAANGVVVITTKQGKGDRMTVNVNYSTNIQTIANRYEMLDANQWGIAYWAASKNSNIAPSHVLYGNGETPVLQPYVAGNTNYPTTNTDWQDQVYRTAWTNNLTASISNNTDKSSVMLSLNYINQDGNIRETFYERYSARINSRYDFNKYISVGENLMLAHWKNRGVDVAGDRGVPFTAMSQHPALPVRGLDGSWARPLELIASDLTNPVQLIENAKDNDYSSWRILGNAYLELKPIEGLSLKTNIGIEHSQYFNHTLGRTVNPGDVNSVSSVYGQGDTWTWTNTANYNKTFADKHHLTVLLGTEAISYTFRDLSASREGYAFEDPDYMQIGAGTGTRSNGGGKTQWSVFSLFGKVDYNYADRYLASFTIRRDENSRFAKGYRAGIFPAFSLAWRPTQEEFFSQNNVLSDLKVRYSWGQNGNANIPSLYPAYSTYIFNTGNGAYDISGTNSSTTSGITLSSTGNPELKWETTYQHNIGADFQFFSGALGLSADYYIKKTKDMLTIPPALDVAGENAAMWLNTGSMENKGWEIALSYNSPSYGDFSWNGSINVAQYKNKLLELNSRQNFIGGDQRLIPGQPMGVYYGYVCDGIFQNEVEVANHATQTGAAPGRLIYRDLDGNGVIDDNDRCIIGDPNPDLSMGLNLTFRYKDFSLDMFFAGDFGFDIQNHMKRQLLSMNYGNLSTNRGVEILNAWTPTNTDTDIPALSLTDDNNESRFSSYYVENGSYMKMKYLKLSYALPKNLIKKIGASNLEVYGQVENVFTLTSYTGLDPEILPGEYGARIDNGAYPRPRTFTVGVNFQF